MMPRPLSRFLPLLAMAGCASAAEYRSSYFLDRMRNAQDALYGQVLRHYDSLLAGGGDLAAIHIEKCRFTESAMYDAEEEYNPKEADWEACRDGLFRRHAGDARVASYRLSGLFGDSAISHGKSILDSIAARRLRNVEDSIVAGIHFRLGQAYQFADSPQRALSAYLTAARLGDTSDMRLATARIWAGLGKPARAREALLGDAPGFPPAPRAAKPFRPWENNQAAALLLKLGYAEDAIRLYRSTIDDSLQSDPEGMAGAMEKAGLIDSARKYREKSRRFRYDAAGAARDRFEFDLAHSGGREALASYRALRADGLAVDPFGFHRLRLFFRHPLLPVSASDLAGAALLGLALLAMALLPYLWVLPLHYVGSWQAGLRGGPREAGIGFGHLWVLSAAILIAGFLATGLFQHHLVSGFFGQAAGIGAQEGTDAAKAHYLACFSGLSAVFTAAFLWRAKGAAFFRNRETLSRSFAYLVIFMSLVYAVRWANLAVFPEDLEAVRKDLPEVGVLAFIKSCLAAWGLKPTLLIVAGLAPFYEEVLFRGVFLQSAGRYLPFWPVNIVQAACFAFLHEGWTRFPTLFAMGLGLGWIARRTGGLIVPIAAHAINNAIAVTAIWILTGRG